jgi:hypothetical protein
MALLVQFLLRASFGLAAAMTTVSPRQVTSGYFRNHLYVILGLSALAALLSRAAAPAAFGWALATAVLSYAGSIAWLYEKRRAGLAALAAVAAAALIGLIAITSEPPSSAASVQPRAEGDRLAIALYYAQSVTSGLLIGFTMASMLLGHWYLNVPGMQLAPLRKLLLAMAIAVAVHAVVCAAGLWLEALSRPLSTQDWLFLLLRWSFGLFGVAVLIWLARETLAIPNTQSATGILYVAVMGVFVGETMSLLLSAGSRYPV